MTQPLVLQLVRPERDTYAAEIVRELDRTIDRAIPNDPSGFIPTREQPCPIMRERGVWWADWFYKGQPFAYSIDSNHDWHHFLVWKPDETREDVEAALWRHLDDTDPVTL